MPPHTRLPRLGRQEHQTAASMPPPTAALATTVSAALLAAPAASAPARCATPSTFLFHSPARFRPRAGLAPTALHAAPRRRRRAPRRRHYAMAPLPRRGPRLREGAGRGRGPQPPRL